MSHIIGLLGMSQAGKDEIGIEFKKHGFARYAFGDAVKEQYAEVNNFPIEEMYNERKEFHRPGIISLGEGARAINPFHWVDKIKNDIYSDFSNGLSVVITDMRRIPEIIYIKTLKDTFGDRVKLFEVVRPLENEGKFDDDKETSHAIVYGHYYKVIDGIIYNNSTQQDLAYKINDLIQNSIKIKQ